MSCEQCKDIPKYAKWDPFGNSTATEKWIHAEAVGLILARAVILYAAQLDPHLQMLEKIGKDLDEKLPPLPPTQMPWVGLSSYEEIAKTLRICYLDEEAKRRGPLGLV